MPEESPRVTPEQGVSDERASSDCALLDTISADFRDDFRRHCARCNGIGAECMVEVARAHALHRSSMSN